MIFLFPARFLLLPALIILGFVALELTHVNIAAASAASIILLFMGYNAVTGRGHPWRAAFIGLIVWATLFVIIRDHARGDTLPPQSERTAYFYKAHPDLADRVMRSCVGDPGHARNSPDCDNAFQARIWLYMDRHASTTNHHYSPKDVRWWMENPSATVQAMKQCPHMTPEMRVMFGDCDLAGRAARKMLGE
jgi:hypothetical protein